MVSIQRSSTVILLGIGFVLSASVSAPAQVVNNTSSVGGATANSIIIETDASPNTRRWIQTLNGGILKFQITRDDGTVPFDYLKITRTSFTSADVEIPRLFSPASGYHNWGKLYGSSGYGFRDNAGTLEFKNQSGLWQSLSTPSPSGGGWVDSGTGLQTVTGTDSVTAGYFNRVAFASSLDGTTAADKIAAAIALLPASGGVIDANGFESTGHNWASNPFNGVTKPVVLRLGSTGTTIVSTNMTLPANVTIQSEGAILAPSVGVALTVNGDVIAPRKQIFAGAGTVNLNESPVAEVYPEWFGASTAVADNSGAFNTAILSAGDGKAVSCGGGTFFTTQQITVSKQVRLYGPMAWFSPSTGACHIESTNPTLGKVISITTEAILEEIRISGPGPSGTNVGIGIDASQVQLNRIALTGGLTYGIKDNSSSAKSWTYVSNSYISGMDVGWDVVGNLKVSNGTTFYHNRIGIQAGENGAVVNLSVMGGSEFEVFADSGATARGIHLVRVKGFSMKETHCETNHPGQRCISGRVTALEASGGHIAGNYFQGAGVTEFAIQPGSPLFRDVVIEGNYFTGYTEGALSAQGTRITWGAGNHLDGIPISSRDLLPHVRVWHDTDGVLNLDGLVLHNSTKLKSDKIICWTSGAATDRCDTTLSRKDANIVESAGSFSALSGYLVGGAIPVTSGTGAPVGSCTTGGLYLRTDGGSGSTLYVCESTAWAAK